MVLLIVVMIWVIWSNTALMVHSMTCTSDKIPKSFDGFHIAQISDFHESKFGKNNEKLVTKLTDCAPDMIVVTGDFVESMDMDVGISFARQMVRIAPTYYVPGNHEARIREYPQVKRALEAVGIVVLQNEKVAFEKGAEKISVAGLMDPSFSRNRAEDTVRGVLEKLRGDEYTILLSHRPELFEIYAEYDVDLVFSGHAHGGQIRLPWIGGIFSPNQGLFPRYDAGMYSANQTTMIVSRGLGNHVLVPRVNNRPEIVLVELKCK